VGGYFGEHVGKTNELIKGSDCLGEGGPMGALLVPGVQHHLVDGFRAVHGRRESVALFNGLDHVLVTPVPVRPLPIGHYFPAHDPKAPDVRGRREFSKRNRFRGSPANRDLPTLNNQNRSENKTKRNSQPPWQNSTESRG